MPDHLSTPPPGVCLFNGVFTTLRRYLFVLIALPAMSLHASELTTVTLSFERQGLELASGDVIERNAFDLSQDGADLAIGYHADLVPHARIHPMSGAEIAWLVNTPLTNVVAEDITGADFSPKAEDIPLGSDNSALMKTSDGSVYLIGNATETDQGVSLQYMRVE